MLQKKGILSLLVVFLAVGFSCSIDEEIRNAQNSNLEFSKFLSEFPEFADNIDKSSIQRTELKNQENTIQAKNQIEGVTFPIIENGEIVGRYLGLNNESVALYFDFTDYKNQVVIYDANDSTRFEIVKIDHDSKSNRYSFEDKYSKGGWCAISCGLGTLAIILSDGPAPVMDLLALAFEAACLADCASK